MNTNDIIWMKVHISLKLSKKSPGFCGHWPRTLAGMTRLSVFSSGIYLHYKCIIKLLVTYGYIYGYTMLYHYIWVISPRLVLYPIIVPHFDQRWTFKALSPPAKKNWLIGIPPMDCDIPHYTLGSIIHKLIINRVCPKMMNFTRKWRVCPEGGRWRKKPWDSWC